MEYVLTINGSLPNLNDYITACRTNPYVGAKMKANAEAIVMQAITEQLGRTSFSSPVYMEYRWYEKNKRRDLDNISSFGRKVIQDALVKTKVLKNDGWDNIEGFEDSFYVDKEHPRIEVTIFT